MKRIPIALDNIVQQPRRTNEDENVWTRNNLEIAQSLLRQTNSIDHTAELMAECDVKVSYYRNNIIRAVTVGLLII